jgi:hypothetical protein
MAERIVSPGVFTRENDLSFLSQGVGEIGAAFIGPFKEGPAFVPTIVRTQSEFEEIFGTPDGTYYTEYAVQNYLREAGTATIVRVGGIGGYSQTAPLAIIASGSSVPGGGVNGKILGVLYNRQAGLQNQGFPDSVITQDTNTTGSFTIGGPNWPGPFGEISIYPSSNKDISDVFGTSPFTAPQLPQAYSYIYFENFAERELTSTVGNEKDFEITEQALPPQEYGDVSHAITPWIISQQISGQSYELFKFHTLGDGTTTNTKFKVGISGVKAAGEDGSTDYSVFSVTVRRFDDTDRRKVVLETFNNVNLDPASPNYIARVIGDRSVTIGLDGKITEKGDYSNRSKYIRVEVVEPGSFPISAAPFGHKAYLSPINDGVNGSLLPSPVYTDKSINNTASNPSLFGGIDLETLNARVDNRQLFSPIPTSVDFGLGGDFSFDTFGLEMTGSLVSDMVKRQFIIGFQEGFDGLNPVIKPALGETITNTNTQGFDCSSADASGSISYRRAIAAVSNADEFDINMVVTPGIIRRIHSTVTDRVIDMVESRQDAFYIADFVEVDKTIEDVIDQANQVDSNYAATYYPWVRTIDRNTNKLTSVPPSTLLPAVFAANDRLAAEWFAPAGLNRGGITGAVNVVNRLTHSERDDLYENKVNPIATFPGQGIVAYGQKTLQDRASALDRINVRRLLITVKKFVASTSRFLVFEQNTSETRNRFLNTVNPYFEAIQQRQGLFAFNVVMDESNNTPDVIDRNILAGQIFLQPAKTAEFIVIDFNILPTGASFSA